MERAAGVLMHITSLPSPYGIGTLGKEAYAFADFLHAGGQKYWQILPVVPTGYGDSPYQSFSTFAGNPYMIDLDLLRQDGYLYPGEYENEEWGVRADRVDFGLLYRNRYPVLRLACGRFLQNPPDDFHAFCEKETWLPGYALFMALKDACGGRPWQEWPADLRARRPEALAAAREKYAGDIAFWKAVQYLFAKQWRDLKTYVNGRGIRIIGDLPIYVSEDSVDVWESPSLFQLDRHLCPTEVAGCPPDGFSDVGQLWGNPLYDWDKMKEDGYSWWIRRIAHVLSIYDVVRIDHFRGFAGYYAIPYGRTDARVGRWRKGPGISLFRAVEEALGKRNIIAEDLGFLGEDVRKLLQETGYPGMKLMEFAFDTRDGGDYLPHTYIRNCVAYTGTHDNEPVNGWFAGARTEDAQKAIEYLKLTKSEGYSWGMMRGVWSSVADLAVVQAQDLLELGHDARMNTPSTSSGNWCWRALPGVFTPELAHRLRHETELYGRG